MSISIKVTSAIAFMTVLMGLSVYGLQRFLVYPEFENLEKEYARLNINRVANRFSVALSTLDATVYDWSSWDDTYEFAHNRNTNFVSSNLYPGTFLNYGTDLVLFIDREFEVLWAGIYEFNEGYDVMDVTEDKLSDLLPYVMDYSSQIDLEAHVDDQVYLGVFTFLGEPALFAVRPIYASHALGDAGGFMLLGTTLTEDILSQLQEDVALKFDISDVRTHASLDSAIAYEIVATDPNALRIQHPFKAGQTGGFMITMVMDRQITKIGETATQQVIQAFIGIAFVVMLVTWWWLRRAVTAPVEQLSRQMKHISEQKIYTHRAQIASTGELGQLARTFNDLMTTVEHKTLALHESNMQMQAEHKQLISTQTQLKRANWELKSLSEKDALTGLYNRMALDRKLAQEWNNLRRRKEPFTLMMIDIDQFKQFNDHYGHQAGDKCLSRVAIIIASIAQRATDMAARYGGEEFMVILPGVGHEAAQQLAVRLLRSIEDANIEHIYSDHNQRITVSIGISSVIPDGSLTVKNAIQMADEALYRAKAGGRNRVCDGSTELT